MYKPSLITFTAILTIAIAGCTIGDTGTPEATNTADPNATPPVATNTEPQIPTFQNPPIVPPQNTPPVTPSVPSLIQSTNTKERLDLLTRGRPDPFAQIIGQQVPLSQVPLSSDTPGGIRQVPTLPPLPVSIAPQPKPQIKPQPKPQIKPKPKPSVANVLPKVQPQVITNPPLASVLPPTPQPNAAKAVLVTGVVLIGKAPQAIIKVPEESTGRYVRAGQRLVNGVLIKRIEMNKGSNPVVILEQNGIEVSKEVGETSAITPNPS
ncbi:hypothetical protein VB711_20540 [Cronbergia sp. UHCC 0137]|uniref:hypothetical protein n=1 Tax=Cronbergia sp. UHCC 0137 TaxID=3110239 RepID=UPI002B2170CE|nr:hypothetical protein [Cronbergia sp. UHCC 0137]MEA5620215.1 hypothetical protein [Cronbergia sp. UHCC 0137]